MPTFRIPVGFAAICFATIRSNMSPGKTYTFAVLTSAPFETREVKRVFNILADRVETVTPWLAEQVLNAKNNGATITWLSNLTAFGRFMTAPFQKRDLFTEASP